MVEGIDDNTANQDQLKREDGEEVDIEAFFNLFRLIYIGSFRGIEIVVLNLEVFVDRLENFDFSHLI